MKTKFENIEQELKNCQEGCNTKIDSLGEKIDDTLTESISILKNDYDSKIEEVKSLVELLKQENVSALESIEARLERKSNEKITVVNTELVEKINYICDASAKREEELLEKMEDMSKAVDFVNKKMECINVQLDDVQEKMYDFEQNKRNNLIFYGVAGEDKENRDDLRLKISKLLRLHYNMKRDIPVTKVSRMMTGNISLQLLTFYNGAWS